LSGVEEKLISKDKSEQGWLKELNPQQREAVMYGEGPLLVVAGAGSGKTKTLAYRVSYLISHGIQPDRILLLTFTRRAADEMLKRAASAIKTKTPAIKSVWGGTFHAIANRILRIYAKSIGLSPDFTIIDRSDAEDFIDVIRHDMGFSKKEKRFPRKRTCLAIYSQRVNGEEDLEAVIEKYFPWCEMWHQELNALFKEYVNRKQRQNVLDYDDLLLYWYYLLQDEGLAESVGGRFDYILVDEYQDTNKVQAGILTGMRRQNKNIMVVGDDVQSIYSFRSATIRNMLDFPKQFPGTQIVTLEQNYRSRIPILETTNELIAQATERYSKDLWSDRSGANKPKFITCTDEDQQDEKVIDQILDHYEQGIPLRRQAVLFRASSHSITLEFALTRRNIPFHKYGGLRFLETAHIKDLISFLRIIENPRDEIGWFRVLQLLNGVGPATAASVIDHVRRNSFNPSSVATFKAPPAAVEEMAKLGSLMKDISRLEDEPPSVQIERICRLYLPLMERNYENPEPRAKDIEYLGKLSAGYKSRKQFLADLILDPPQSTSDLAGKPTRDEDWLILSTIHSAKGLEWDAVYLIHAADGYLPSDLSTGSTQEVEEELRLAYVAMTRARDFLYVLWPLRYYIRHYGLSGRHGFAQRSRFITDKVLRTMDEEEFGKSEVEVDTSITDNIGGDIAAHIRDMWKRSTP
jgi:DNA helicase-2/ATP-dependent DNA helicase PcrA